MQLKLCHKSRSTTPCSVRVKCLNNEITNFSINALACLIIFTVHLDMDIELKVNAFALSGIYKTDKKYKLILCNFCIFNSHLRNISK